MKMRLTKAWLGILLICAVIKNTWTHPNGAPSDATICSNQLPAGHGVPTQTSLSPYVITVSSTAYKPNTPFNVTLETRCSGAGFKGFSLSARYANSSSDQNVLLGNFSGLPSDTQLICSNRAVTHTDPTPKLSRSFQWTISDTGLGPIVFRATFVQSVPIFWQNVSSDPIFEEGQTPNNNTGLVPGLPTPAPDSTGCPEVESTTPQPPANTFPKDSDCGTSKGCFSDCAGNACTFLLSWAPQTGSNNISITLRGYIGDENGTYIAFGLSTDKSMGDDNVNECVKNATGIQIYNSYNDGKNNKRTTSQEGLYLTDSSFVDGIVSCTYLRDAAAGLANNRFALGNGSLWTLLLARGKAGSDNIYKHDSAPVISLTTASFTDTTADLGGSSEDNSMLRKAHGSLMLFAWVFAASIGIVVARYFKPIWPETTIFGLKVWFQIHRTCMVLVLILTVIGFIIIFVSVGGYSDICCENYQKAHPITGIITTGLCVINPIMALFRPHPNTKNRPIFNWAHWAVGICAHILAVVTMFFGSRLSASDAPDYMIYVLAGYVGWQVLVHILLELTKCFSRNTGRSDAYELSANEQTKSTGTEEEASSMKIVILVLHVLVVTGFTIALVVIFNLN